MSTLLSLARSVFSVLLVLFRYLFYRVISSFLTGIVLLFVAVLMFVTFHQAYMPVVSHIKPVHLQFSSECRDKTAVGLCSYPEASVLFMSENKANDERMLMRGQSYKVFLDIEMPSSPTNEKLGMFMVNLKFLSAKGAVLRSSSRSCMLHYESSLVRLFRTLFFSLPLTLGLSEEKQMVEINFFEEYIDDSYNPAVQAKVVIMTKQIEIYKSTLRLQASFTGLRYLIFNYPILFGCLAVVGNFITIALIYSASINQFYSSSHTFATTQQQLTTHPGSSNAIQQNGGPGHSSGTRAAVTPRQQERSTQPSTTRLQQENVPPNTEPTPNSTILQSQERVLHRTTTGCSLFKRKSHQSNRVPLSRVKMSRKQPKKKNCVAATKNCSDDESVCSELDNDINSSSTSQDFVEIGHSGTVGHKMTRTHQTGSSLHFPKLQKVQKSVKNKNSKNDPHFNKSPGANGSSPVDTNSEADLPSNELVEQDSFCFARGWEVLKLPRVRRLGRYLQDTIPGLTKHSRQCRSNLELSRIEESRERYPKKSASTSDLDQIENN